MNIAAAVDESEASLNDHRLAITLPPSCYTSDEFYKFEIDAIFGHEWLCLGRAEQVADVGDYFTITIVGEPLIVVRSSRDEIKVLSAVCRHRGMVVAEGSGNCGKAFRCPYHWWTYKLDGQLISGPEMSQSLRFDRHAIRLPELRCEVWEGFVFATFDDSIAPVSVGAERLAAMWANFRPSELRTTTPYLIKDWPFNWKVMLENAMDAYHGSRLHSLYCGYQPSSNYEEVEFEDNERAVISRIRNLRIDGGLNPSAASGNLCAH
jgi:phenylpropionate dioxygenase-like ring-hydroxylating dioxygenase large terminal subunit